METEELKLRCFEAIIASSKNLQDEANQGQESGAASQPPAAVQPAAAAPIVDATDDLAAPESAASAPATPVSETAIVDADSDVADATADPAQHENAIGQEHLARQGRDQQKDDVLIRAKVVEVSKGRNDLLYFHLDNGQVWRQIEARHYSYPKNSEFEVNIGRGMMGDYRMRIGDNGRLVRIRRVK